jgi:hypothetical protein
MKIGTMPYIQQSMHMAARTKDATTANAPPSDSAPSGTFDFTTMSRSELRNTVNSLIKSGKLSLDDTTGLVSMMGPATYAGRSGPAAAAYENSPFDAFKELRKAIDFAEWRHDDKSAAVFSRTLSALEQLQGTTARLDLKA